jgi:hypothetical protein
MACNLVLIRELPYRIAIKETNRRRLPAECHSDKDEKIREIFLYIMITTFILYFKPPPYKTRKSPPVFVVFIRLHVRVQLPLDGYPRNLLLASSVAIIFFPRKSELC